MRILPIAQIKKKLIQILAGYYHYYGITDNFKGMDDFCFRVRNISETCDTGKIKYLIF